MRHICLITVLFISAICCAESKFNEYYSANPDSNQLYHIRYQNVVVSDLNNIKIDTFYYDENYYKIKYNKLVEEYQELQRKYDLINETQEV